MILVAVALLIGGPFGDGTLPPDSACASIDTPSSGTIKQVAVAKLLPFGSEAPIPDNFAAFVVDAIATHLVLPRPLALSVYTASEKTPGGATVASWMAPSFSSRFLLVFRRDGSVKSVTLSQQSMAPELDAAIARAIHVADSTLSFPPIDQVTDKSALSFFVDLDLADSVSSGTYPVFRVVLPMYPVGRLASQSRKGPSPQYPNELRRQGTSGEVRLKFIVDETGKIADRSYRFMKVSAIPFGESVLAVLPWLRYEPAMIGNCAVKMLVRQSFEFKIGF